MDSSRIAGCALVLSFLVVACSSGTGTTAGDAGASSGGSSGDAAAGGTSGAVPATARVVFDSTIAPGTHTAAECPKSGTWFTIGSFGNPASGEAVRPVDDGANDQGGEVTVSCSVKPSGVGFDVSAQARLAGAAGGAVAITGSFKTAGTQPNVSLVLTKLGESFSAHDCIATIDATVGQGIAAGRVWATIECANAAQPVAQQICRASAQVRFENCAQ